MIMARSFGFIFSLFFFLVLLSFRPLSFAEARPFNVMKDGHQRSNVLRHHECFFTGLALGAIKQSGPRPGEGNKFVDFRSLGLGGRKDGGPSPGQGHWVLVSDVRSFHTSFLIRITFWCVCSVFNRSSISLICYVVIFPFSPLENSAVYVTYTQTNAYIYIYIHKFEKNSLICLSFLLVGSYVYGSG